MIESEFESRKMTTTHPTPYPFLNWVDMNHRDDGSLKGLRHFLNNLRLGQWELCRAMLHNMAAPLVRLVLLALINDDRSFARFSFANKFFLFQCAIGIASRGVSFLVVSRGAGRPQSRRGLSL
jgi:hypothetical protein